VTSSTPQSHSARTGVEAGDGERGQQTALARAAQVDDFALGVEQPNRAEHLDGEFAR
jgi:hypothetical protein